MAVLTVTALFGACSSIDEIPAQQDSTIPTPESEVPGAPDSSLRPTTIPESSDVDTTVAAAESSTTTVSRSGMAPPEWLGSRPLPLRAGEDNGVAQPTPPELEDRRLWTTDHLPPPPDDVFHVQLVTPPPADVIARSTWTEACPVVQEDLAWLTVSFFGFDHRFHTGELLVNTAHAEAIAGVFEELHAMRFPIEEMRVTTQEALDAPPTGDSNNTSSFVCRPAVNSTSWSRHAHGTAVDINPFHNPYVKGDLVIPELASAYLDRDRHDPGMVAADVVGLFADIGWGWGGNWISASDWMHFSDTGT